MDDLSLITWSHSSYSDVWPMYFGQLEKHFPQIKQYMFIDKNSKDISKKCVQLINDENESYCKRFINCLEQVQESNVIYMQEDFILYDSVDEKYIQDLAEYLNQSSYSFIRLIKSGVEGGKCVSESLNLFEIPKGCQYFFSHQATIWKKQDLLKLYRFYRPHHIRDAESYGSHACLNLNMSGCYVYQNEPKRGRHHYDSYVFPYISTAIGKGKWDMSCYEEELNDLFKTYKIDPDRRGIL